MQITTVRIDKPEATNFILGQTHFIKSVEDIHEALVGAVPGIKFGLAFCEASGKCLVRWSGTDPAMVELAARNATALGAGHSFIVFLGDGFYPVNVLNALKMVPEVCRIFCATANPVEVIVAETDQGRGSLGVIDGSSPKGIEGADDVAWRKNLAAADRVQAVSGGVQRITAIVRSVGANAVVERAVAGRLQRSRRSRSTPGGGEPDFALILLRRERVFIRGS